MAIYLPLLAQPFDANAIYEAQAVERGGQALVSPNHLLYRPLGFAAFRAARAAGLAERPYRVLQVVTALCGALAVALAAAAFRRAGAGAPAALLAAAFFATSWAQWSFSTDAHYIAAAAAATAAALLLALTPRRSTRNAAGVGAAAALAVLAWQAAVFALPALILLLWQRPGITRRAALRDGATAVLVATGGAALGYALAARAVGIESPTAFATWIASHSSDAAGRMPFWGRWEWSRLGDTAVSCVSSWIAVWEGLGLRDLRHGVGHGEKILRQLSLLALLTLAALSLTRLRGAVAAPRRRAILGACAFGFLAFLPFLVWWDPFEPKWFVVPNLFAVTACALLWSEEGRRTRQIAAAACVSLIAAANAQATIWPHHTTPSDSLALAACVARRVEARDLLLISDWSWYPFAQYFHDIHVHSFSLVSGRPVEEKLAALRAALRATDARGGRAFLVDPTTLSPEQRRFRQALTGLSADDYASFSLRPAFRCRGRAFARLLSLESPPAATGATR